MRRATPTRTKTTKTATSKIAQQIYLRRASVATRIVAKYASAQTVPTNLLSGAGLTPLTNQTQQAGGGFGAGGSGAAKPLAPPAAPQQPAAPAAPKVEPFPTNVAPPPVPAPAPQALAPGTNMATGKPITPGQPVIAPTTESAQTEIAPAAPTDPAMHIQNPQNKGDFAQMPIAGSPDAHSPITDPAAVKPPPVPTTESAQTEIAAPGQPTGQSNGQPAGQSQQNVAPAAAGQPTTDGQPTGQPAGPPAARPIAEQHAAAEKSLAAAAAPDAPPEAKQQAETDLKGALAAGAEANPAHTAGAKALISNDTKNPDAVAFQKHLDEKVSDEVITQKVEAAYRENPNPTPEQAGGIFAQAQQFWADLPLPAKIMLGLGLPLGLVGLGSSVFGEGGLTGLLTGVLGLGVAGMVGANYGLFGNDARQMMGQGAIGLGRAMGMNIPGKDDFTPEGMAKRQQQVTADVQAAMDAKTDKGQRGGWQAGQQKLDETRKPLDYLAGMDENTAITTLMGAMETNDPSVAKQQYDMLMQKRQELLDPEFLRTQARGQMLQNLPGGDWRETVESRPVLKSLANQALNYVGYGSYPAAQK